MSKTKLYCYNYNFMDGCNTNYGYKIIEVDERENSFKLLDHNESDIVDCRRILKKQDLNVLQVGYFTYYLFSDKPNGKLFKTYLEKAIKEKVDKAKKKYEDFEKKLKAVEALNICD